MLLDITYKDGYVYPPLTEDMISEIIDSIVKARYSEISTESSNLYNNILNLTELLKQAKTGEEILISYKILYNLYLGEFRIDDLSTYIDGKFTFSALNDFLISNKENNSSVDIAVLRERLLILPYKDNKTFLDYYRNNEAKTKSNVPLGNNEYKLVPVFNYLGRRGFVNERKAVEEYLRLLNKYIIEDSCVYKEKYDKDKGEIPFNNIIFKNMLNIIFDNKTNTLSNTREILTAALIQIPSNYENTFYDYNYDQAFNLIINYEDNNLLKYNSMYIDKIFSNIIQVLAKIIDNKNSESIKEITEKTLSLLTGVNKYWRLLVEIKINKALGVGTNELEDDKNNILTENNKLKEEIDRIKLLDINTMSNTELNSYLETAIKSFCKSEIEKSLLGKDIYYRIVICNILDAILDDLNDAQLKNVCDTLKNNLVTDIEKFKSILDDFKSYLINNSNGAFKEGGA